VAVCVAVLAGFGVTGSPYYRVDPGPVVQVGGSGGGSWSVTTARVRTSNWFQWAVAELRGRRTLRAEDGGGDTGQAMADAMRTSQTNAALVAAQLAAGRAPVASAGLQVRRVTGKARAAGLRPGGILLAAGGTPLRTEIDLWTAAARPAVLRVLVVPELPGGRWGAARIDRVPAAALRDVRTSLDVSARVHPLGAVRGPSAGLVLALARVDALTAGDLTGGRRVAGTGAIAVDGGVTTVGDVAEKIRAAAGARTDVFLVPAPQRDEAVRAARGTRMRVVGVHSVTEAVTWLCANGGRALSRVADQPGHHR
jgi:PDZ domain-containing protein